MTDPFALLGLERSWRLTVEDIRTAQRKLAIAAHPDRNIDAAKRLAAVEESSRINEAAAELLDPMSRGNVILNVLSPAPRPADPQLEPAFLMRIMELREAIDSAGNDAKIRSEIADEVQSALGEIELETDSAMAALIARPNERSWVAAFDALNRLRAMRRASDECRR